MVPKNPYVVRVIINREKMESTVFYKASKRSKKVFCISLPADSFSFLSVMEDCMIAAYLEKETAR